MRTTVSSVLINASPDAVWRSLTEPPLVKRWQYHSQLVTDWRVGAPLRFVSEWEGGSFEQWGTVLSFAPPTHLSYSLFAPRADLPDEPENYFTMTYDLAIEGAATLVTITHADPRSDEADAEPTEEESPVLLALKEVAESL